MIVEDFLDHRSNVRRSVEHKDVRALVMHYPNSPRATAFNIRNYFNQTLRYASAHYVVGIDGSIVHMVPEDEKAYHCGAWVYRDGVVEKLGPDPNLTTIGIEMCHKYKNGRLEEATLFYAHLLAAHLCFKYDLNPISDIYRHHDITGKICPLWWVQHVDEFVNFRLWVKRAMTGEAA